MAHFIHEGQRIAYTEHGAGGRVCVLIPGLLTSQRMHSQLAAALADHGEHVVTMDPLGHGESDRPDEMWRHSMRAYASQVVGLLDHLEIEQAVIGGASLGANTTLEVASSAPERLRGMILEMPVLESALLGCAIAFTPLMCAQTFAAPVMRGVGRAASLIPRKGMPLLGEVLLDWIEQDPRPGSAVMRGLFFERVAPPREERRTFEAPALIIGHPRDPVHPFSDAGLLASELRNSRLLEANSIIELRSRPARLTGEIVEFIDQCWAKPDVKSARRKAATKPKRTATTSGARRQPASRKKPTAARA
jgi:pimeloyl-ACP methyl ester carboxylesterase